MQEVDARGRPCPQPVLMTKKAVDAGATELKVIVDNPGSAENVTRFAEKEGFQVSRERSGNDIVLTLVKSAAKQASAEAVGGAAAASPAAGGSTSSVSEIVCSTGTWKIHNDQVLFLSSDRVGRGDDELGKVLVESLLNTLADNDALPKTIVLVNTGVKLACGDAPTVDALKKIEGKGVEILACGTCLNFFGLADQLKAGRVSNAFEILNTLLGAGRIVNW